MPKQVEFTPPKGFVAPEGKQNGDTFESMATFKIKGNRLCLVEIGDVPMPGYEDKADYSAKPDEGAAVVSKYREAAYGA